MIDKDAFYRLLGEFFPQALDFIGDQENYKKIDYVMKSSATLPQLEAVEYDEDNRVVYIKIRIEPKLGVDIKEYADAVDDIARKVLNLIISFAVSKGKS